MRLVPLAHSRHLAGPRRFGLRDRREQLGERLVGGCERGPAADLEAHIDGLRSRRPDAGHELQRSKRGNAVLRVVGPAQECQQVLDVRRFQEFQAAVLHVRDVPPHELELQHVAVMRAAK